MTSREATPNREARPINEIMAGLADAGKPLSSTSLSRLSHLNRGDLGILLVAWPQIEAARRLQIVHRLKELSEDNVELSFDNIFKACLRDSDAEVRRQAIEGLWESEDASLVTPLVNLLENDGSEKVQAAAAAALERFVILAEENKLLRDYLPLIYQTLFNTLNNPARPLEVRRRSLESLAPMSRPEVIRAINDAYGGDNARMKISAIYAMGKNCDGRWLPILLKELVSPDAEIRYEAAAALGEIGEETAVIRLIELMQDPDMAVRLVAIQSLGKTGGSVAKTCLLRQRKDRNTAVKEAADEALQELEAWENPMSFRG
jgi:HEAT repeat protein